MYTSLRLVLEAVSPPTRMTRRAKRETSRLRDHSSSMSSPELHQCHKSHGKIIRLATHAVDQTLPDIQAEDAAKAVERNSPVKDLPINLAATLMDAFIKKSGNTHSQAAFRSSNGKIPKELRPKMQEWPG